MTTIFQFKSDRAITDLAADRLDRGRFVESLSNAIVKPNGKGASGITVGLVGRWGEGKSSVLQLLKKDLGERYGKTVIVEFSPWLVSQRHDLVRAFCSELGRAVGREFSSGIHSDRRSQITEELIGALSDYVDRIAPMLEAVHPGGKVTGKVFAFVLKRISALYADLHADEKKLVALKGRVEDLLAALQIPVVALIDEVDRIDASDIRELMHVVKAVADFPSISYVLAYDETKVAEALGYEAPVLSDRIIRGRKYLEKIVQLPIQLPIIFNNELDQLLDVAVREALAVEAFGSGYSDARYKELRSIMVPALVSNARDINRLVSAFAHRLGLVAGDVEWVDVLGFVALVLFAPELSEKVRSAPESFVFDGSISAYVANRSFDDLFKSLAPPSEQSSVLQKLFAFLFPAMSKTRTHADCLLDEVAFRRPLLTVLRMKTLPTEVSRADVLDIANLDAQDLQDAMEKISNSGKAISFAERLADSMRHGPVSNSRQLWITLMETVDRIPRTSWAAVLGRMLALRDISETIVSLLSRDVALSAELRQLIEALSHSDAYDAAALLIRRARNNRERGSEAVKIALERSGVDDQWLTSMGRFVVERAKSDAVARGTTLSAGTVYLANQVDAWTSDDKDRYARVLLANDEAFDAFIVDCFGAFYVVGSDTIERLFIPLAEFKPRFMRRWRLVKTNEAFELRDAYTRAIENLNLEEETDDGLGQTHPSGSP